jgi:hypothetical protein
MNPTDPPAPAGDAKRETISIEPETLFVVNCPKCGVGSSDYDYSGVCRACRSLPPAPGAPPGGEEDDWEKSFNVSVDRQRERMATDVLERTNGGSPSLFDRDLWVILAGADRLASRVRELVAEVEALRRVGDDGDYKRGLNDAIAEVQCEAEAWRKMQIINMDHLDFADSLDGLVEHMKSGPEKWAEKRAEVAALPLPADSPKT